MKLSERQIVARLRRGGYRVTPQRRTIIRTILASPDHLTPTEIYRRVGRRHPGIGLVTVYRTLELLASHDLVCELHTGGACPSYTIAGSRHHHHLICTGCGKVVDFTGHNLEQLEERLARQSGFRIEEHRLEFLGRCPGCRVDDTAAGGGAAP